MKKPILLLFALALSAGLGVAALRGMRAEQFSPWTATGDSIYDLTFSPDDSRFAAIAAPTDEAGDTRLLVVDRSSGNKLLEAEGIMILNPCFDPTGKHLAVFVGRNLVVFDLHVGEPLFTVNRMEIFDGAMAAMGFAGDGTSLVLDRFTAFGFEQNPPERLAFAVPSGELIEATEEPDFWYGDGLASDGTKWFRGGFPGPTPRVFRRSGEFIGYCMRWPNIRNAWFSRCGTRLISLHRDGALVRWDLSEIDDKGACASSSAVKMEWLLECQSLCPLNTEDSFAVIDRQGRLVRQRFPDWHNAEQPRPPEPAADSTPDGTFSPPAQ